MHGLGQEVCLAADEAAPLHQTALSCVAIAPTQSEDEEPDLPVWNQGKLGGEGGV